MKNKFSKSGFTLIELLSTIIIIIVVLTISVPLIQSMVEIAQREAFRATAHSIADSGRILIANENESQGYQEFYYLEGKEYNIDGKKLDYAGDGPKTGVVILTEKNKVVLAIHSGTYCATKSANTNTVAVAKTLPEDCKAYNIIKTCDSWEQIAIQYDVSLEALLEANEETDSNSSTCDRDIKIPISPISSGGSYAGGDGDGDAIYYKTYYTMGYVSTSVTLPFSYEYTIELGVLPLAVENIKEARVTMQSVFEELPEFERYIVKKNMGEVIWPGGDAAPINIDKASVFRDHAATSSNLTADEVVITCDTESCYASVKATLDNLTNVNPNTIEGAGEVAYAPIKFTVEFNGAINDLIAAGYIPVANATELNNIRFNSENIFGKDTKWEKKYIGGLDKKYIQAKDINLGVGEWSSGEGWLPLGTAIFSNEAVSDTEYAPIAGTPFSGIYNGGGHKISNLYINRTTSTVPVALFASSSGSFSNMILENVNVTGGISQFSLPTAALVGQATGNTINNIYMKDITITGNITAVGEDAGKVGSLIGQALDLNKVSITNTSFQGNITSAYNLTGGLIGQLRKYNELLIDNTTVKGTIVSNDNKTAGFIGEVSYDKIDRWDALDIVELSQVLPTSKSVTVKNSSFQGDVISQNNMTAGFFGEVRYVDSLIIDGSYVEGDIISDYNKTAGVIGELSFVKDIIFNDVHHEGSIVSTYNRTGGLIGGIWYINNLTIDNSYNRGSVLSDGGKTGGLIGEITMVGNNGYETLPDINSVTIKNSYAYGNVKGTFNKIGGIIGEVSDVNQFLMDNVNYEGQVHAADDKTAGLIGSVIDVRSLNVKNSNVDATILGCENSLGGIIGRIEYVDSTVLENNTFDGAIKLAEDQDSLYIYYRANRIGGIVGGVGGDSGRDGKPEPYTGTLSIKGCDVKADIEAYGSRIGGIIGGSDVTYYIEEAYDIYIEDSSFEGNLTINNSTSRIDTRDGAVTTYNPQFVLAGGLVGSANKVTINNSYGKGTLKVITSSTPAVCKKLILTEHVIGDIVGLINNGATITNSYSDIIISNVVGD
ncbi:MAG: hypothetical protein PHT75_00640 [Bacilli bacterium]|nr:hypothetical protein [Bacilli bacterium]MDD3304623.1 hypothetical protein [Bacilli bacterium]MDD4053536.1 hypothetical protein [Bacilli bacterium]MDD4411497.1 hypothetical protein [Bacilli bacterium]